MKAQQTHPGLDELSAFALGQLDDEASAAIESHLAGCADCCASLESVREDTFVARLRTSVQSETVPIGPRSHDAPAGELPAASPRVASTSLAQGEDLVAPQADARSRADPGDVRSLVTASLAPAHAFLASPTVTAEVPML